MKTKWIVALCLGLAALVQLAFSLGHYFDGWVVNSAICGIEACACFGAAIS